MVSARDEHQAAERPGDPRPVPHPDPTKNPVSAGPRLTQAEQKRDLRELVEKIVRLWGQPERNCR